MRAPLLTLLIVLALPFFAEPGRAQSLEGGARGVALGSATTALDDEVWGHANPAAWATREGRALSVFVSEAFGLTALRLGAFHLVEPTRFGAFAATARTFGFEDYRETHLSLGYARGFRLGTQRTFLAGVRLRYHSVSIPTYGSGGAITVSAGWLVNILPALDLGVHGANLNAPKLNGVDEIERTLSVGLAYRPDDRVRLLADVFKETRFPLSVRGGLEVLPVGGLALRTGFTTEPTRFTAGVGVRLRRLAADVAAERHDVLGWSPAFSLGIRW